MSISDEDRLRVAILGPVRAWLGEREIDLGQTRQRVLFAVLAAAAGRRVGQAELIDGIWGAAPPATAAGSVYTYISGLRRSLAPYGHELLVSQASGYALRLRLDDLDSERFAAMVAEAADRRVAGDLPGAAAVLDEALRLWQGDAYAGLDGDRLTLERAHLQERRFAAVESRARILTELGDGDLVAELIAMIHRYPFHEPLHELLMLALHRSGRNAEALDVFRAARRTLAAELGVEPGEALLDLHRRVLNAATSGRDTEPQPPMPDEVARALRVEGIRLGDGGDANAQRLRTAVAGLVAGAGGAAWIEGEPGTGKTRLMAGVLADAVEAGCRVARATADELDRLVPLRVIARALDLPEVGAQRITAQRILEHVCSACAVTPLLLAVDDLHLGDEDSQRLWRRLAAASRRHRLLLVAAVRRDAAGALGGLRRAVGDRQGLMISLEVLSHDAAQRLTGAPAVGLLPADTRRTLSRAALLGNEFTTDDLVAICRRTAFDLVGDLEKALAAGVLTDTGSGLAFRQQAQRHELCAGIPPGERAVLRRDLARALHERGSPPVAVAAQLAEDTLATDGWVVRWAVAHLPHISERAPRLTAMLTRRILRTEAADATQRAALLTTCVRADLGDGGQPVEEAREALGLAVDAGGRAEMRHALASALLRRSDRDLALRLLGDAIGDPQTPQAWCLRHRALAARARRGDLTDLDAAERQARRALAEAEGRNERYEGAFAAQSACIVYTARRDHDRALRFAERGLDLVRDRDELVSLHVELLGDRVRTLQNLDRLAEADRTLRDAALLAVRHGLPLRLQGASAAQNYWLGRWDDALAEVPSAAVTHEPAVFAVAALITVRRADVDLADEYALAEDADDLRGFRLAARAHITEHRHGAAAALGILESLVRPAVRPAQPRHPWLPYAVRLALDDGDQAFAQRVAAACAEEERLEAPRAGVHYAAAHCQALLAGDPAPVLSAAAHYRAAGRTIERAVALEDAGVLLAARRSPHEAARSGGEAAGIYAMLGAHADLRRLDRRLSSYGVTVDASLTDTATGPGAGS